MLCAPPFVLCSRLLPALFVCVQSTDYIEMLLRGGEGGIGHEEIDKTIDNIRELVKVRYEEAPQGATDVVHFNLREMILVQTVQRLEALMDCDLPNDDGPTTGTYEINEMNGVPPSPRSTRSTDEEHEEAPPVDPPLLAKYFPGSEMRRVAAACATFLAHAKQAGFHASTSDAFVATVEPSAFERDLGELVDKAAYLESFAPKVAELLEAGHTGMGW